MVVLTTTVGMNCTFLQIDSDENENHVTDPDPIKFQFHLPVCG